MNSNYDSSSLKALKGLEGVRKRPGMYIGSTDVNGLHHLVWEVVDNAVDEVLAGFATKIKVKLNADNSVTVEDNGRGIPVDIHKDSGKSGVELVFTELHAGGKFDEGGAYKQSGGLHGVGASVVNALSTRLEVTVYKNGFEYFTSFENGGNIVQQTKQIGTTTKKGSKIQFWPDFTIFKSVSLSYETVRERLRESSFLMTGLEINLTSATDNMNETFVSKDGIKNFIEFINESKNVLTPAISFGGTVGKINIEVGFQYTDDYHETILSFVNNVKTRDGGTHVRGLKAAWQKVVNDFAREQGLLKAKDPILDGQDIREGAVMIVSVKVPESLLEFVGQTKDSLRTPEAAPAVEEIVSKELVFWLKENKDLAKTIVNKSILASKARNAARKAREEARAVKKNLGENRLVSGKLTPAQSKNPLERELFLVEGDSAGGSAKLGRDRRTQAILPLRGKVVNTEKAKLADILKNEEISTIINTINAGVGKDFDVSQAQYGKVVIMTDADTDGAHIQILLLTFLYRHMLPLIESGRVYIALPPLYKISKSVGGKMVEEYAWDESQLDDSLTKLKGADIQRYKGLGEMNADQLWDTTMNPATRTLIQVKIGDPALVERRVSTLMGDNVEPRKEWINGNVRFTLEDDYTETKEIKISLVSK